MADQNFEVKELSQVKREMTVRVPAAEVDKTLNRLYKDVQKNAKLRGFRPGKAPRAVLERYYGGQVTMEASEGLIAAHYSESLRSADLMPVAQPAFDFEEPPTAHTDFVFTVVFDVRPEFELNPEQYRGLELKEPDYQATEDEINERLEYLRQQHGVLKPVDEDRTAAKGDVVIVDYESVENGESVAGGKAENQEVELGAGRTLEAIETALTGAKKGQEVSAQVVYGDDGPEHLKGKTVDFKLTVKELRLKVLPELDDDFARSLGPDFDDLESLKARIKDDMDKMYAQQREHALRTQIMDKVRGLGEFEVPQSLVDEEAESMVSSFEDRLRRQGMDPAQNPGFDRERLKADLRERAEKKVRGGIVLGKISDLEDVQVGPEDLEAELARQAEETGQPAEVLKEIYNKNNAMAGLEAHVLEEKTLQAIKANANIKVVDPAELAEDTANSSQEPTEAPAAS